MGSFCTFVWDSEERFSPMIVWVTLLCSQLVGQWPGISMTLFDLTRTLAWSTSSAERFGCPILRNPICIDMFLYMYTYTLYIYIYMFFYILYRCLRFIYVDTRYNVSIDISGWISPDPLVTASTSPMDSPAPGASMEADASLRWQVPGTNCHTSVNSWIGC